MTDTITQAEAAGLLGVHRNTILNYLNDGRLFSYRRDTRGRRLLDRQVVEAFARGVGVRRA
jgi:excisionase family DNA binding protein